MLHFINRIRFLMILFVSFTLFILAPAPKAETQQGGCSISGFTRSPDASSYPFGTIVHLSGTSNCGTVKFEILQNGVVVRELSEIGQPNQTASWHTNETGSGNFDVCFVARGDLPWAQANRDCSGSPKYVEPPIDGDGDGVPDNVDACPGQGSIGYGVYPNGCPIQDVDGDGVSDPNDACPNQGGIGFGIYPNGCPILDGDGDGVPDPSDACPGQGSIGYGVNASGCPIQPPPPSDRDGDGVPDNTDRCPDQGNEGNGIDGFGCPNQPPPPPANDGDGDGILDNEDRCPTEPGPRANGGCPIIPPTCYISFLANLVNLRSGPSTVYNSVTTKNYTNEPVRVVGLVTNPNNPSETWYELEGGVFAIANPNWVRLGQPCDFSQPSTIDIPIEITDSDADGIPDVIDVCTETGDAGYGVKNDGCPKTMQDILTNVRESHPRDVMRLLGCEIVTGELLDTAPLFVLMTIVESPNPCDAKAEYNRQQQTIPSLEIAQAYFRESPAQQQFFEQLITCDLYISNHLVEIIANSEDLTVIDSFIAQIIKDEHEDICEQLFEWRNMLDIVPIPPDLSPNDSINWGILICVPHNLSNTRYQQLVSNLLEIWELDITQITCDDINSANRIGNPSQDHLNLFGKLLECQNENNIILKPIWTLEKLIINNADHASLLDLSCEELLTNTYCADTDCTPDIELPLELQMCALSNEDKQLMILFIKNYIPKAGEEAVEGKLSQAQLDLIYADINSCDAVIQFLNTGVIRQPIELPPPVVVLPPPSDDDNSQNPPEITPVPTPELILTPVAPPILTTTIVVEALKPPIPENNKESENILSALGLNKNETNTAFANMLGIVYVRDNIIYIRENGIETEFEYEQEGEKYSPIIFTLNNRRILAYILVQNGVARIWIHNLDIGDAIFAILPDDITPDHESRLAYSNSLLVFTGIDYKNQYNLYGISFSGTAKIDTSYLLITNAKNASAVEGLGGFVFEQPGGTNNIQLWIPNRNALTPIDEQIEGSCNNPIGETYKGKWRFWFLCDYYDEPTLFVHAMEGNRPDVVDINAQLKNEGANIATIRLSLGELQGELFISDGENIFLYHQRQGLYKVIHLLNGTSLVYTFSRE